MSPPLRRVERSAHPAELHEDHAACSSHHAGVALSGRGYDWCMGIVIVLLLLALLFGGIGLLVEGLIWLLIIAGVLVVLGAVFGVRGRGRG